MVPTGFAHNGTSPPTTATAMSERDPPDLEMEEVPPAVPMTLPLPGADAAASTTVSFDNSKQLKQMENKPADPEATLSPNSGRKGTVAARKQTKFFDAIESTVVSVEDKWGRFLPLYKLWTYTFAPTCKLHRFWDAIVLAAVIVSAVWEPYTVTFHFHSLFTADEVWFEPLIDVIFYLDMIVAFWTSYDTGYTQEKDKTKIAIRYLKGWFFVDFISTINWDLMVISANAGVIDRETHNVIIMLRLLKCLRLFRVSRLIAALTMNLNTDSSFIEAGKFFFYVFIVAHTMACFFFIIPLLNDKAATSWWADAGIDKMRPTYQYTYCLYWAFTTMTTIGYGDISPIQHEEYIFVIFAEGIGVGFFAILMTQINNVNKAVNLHTQTANSKKDAIISFIKLTAIPKEPKNELLDKVRKFLEFKTKSHFHSFADNDARFECLSYALRNEIRKHVFLPSLLRIKMFDDTEEQAAVDELLEKLDTDEVKGFIDDSEMKQMSEDTNLNMSDEDIKQAMDDMGRNEQGQVPVAAFHEWYHLQKYNCPRLEIPMPFTAYLASRMKACAFSPDDIVVKKGEYGIQFFIVLTGAVDIIKRKFFDSHAKQKTLRSAIRGIVRMNKSASMKIKTTPPDEENKEKGEDKTGDGGEGESGKKKITVASVPSLKLSDVTGEEEGGSTAASPRTFGLETPSFNMPRLSSNAASNGVGAAAVRSDEGTETIKAYHRYPVFGIPAALPQKQSRMLKDQCRRWEAKVGRAGEEDELGCCDVAYISRHELMQIFNATWDIGPKLFANFAQYHYNIKFDKTNVGSLSIANPDYEDRANIVQARTKFKTLIEQDHVAEQKDEISGLTNAISALTASMVFATKMTETRCRLINESITSVTNRL